MLQEWVNPADSIKLDLYYSMDPFFQEAGIVDGIRMATADEIFAMKVNIIQRGGRKKDFWDLHEALNKYTIEEMMQFGANIKQFRIQVMKCGTLSLFLPCCLPRYLHYAL